MQTNVEVVIDDAISADDWAAAEPVVTQEEKRRELSEQVDLYIRRGGTIDEVPMGATARYIVDFTSKLKTTSVFSAEHRSTHMIAQLVAIEKRYKGKDAELVKEVNAQLALSRNALEICKVIQCSECKLQRLLREYFPDDERAHRLKRRNQDDKLAALAVKAKRAVGEGIQGINNIARYCGVSYETLLKHEANLGVSIPRQKNGKKAAHETN